MHIRRMTWKTTLLNPALFLFLALPLAAQTSNITVNPAVTFEEWKYWMALISAPVGFGGTPAEASNWPEFKPLFLNQLVNQLGINTIQLTEPSGDIENFQDCWTNAIAIHSSQEDWAACRYSPVNDDANPNHFNCADATLVNCPTSFALSYFDYTMNQYIAGDGGMRAMVQANGEAFHLILQWIHWPTASGYLDQSAAEVGEQILAVFLHSQDKFGFVPDIVDMMVEPDNHADASVPAQDKNAGGVWDFVNLGSAAVAVKERLNAAGFHPEIWCCSVTSTAHAVAWYAGAKASAGAGAINGFTTHWYDQSNAHWGAIDAQANADRVPVIMTEFDAAGLSDLYHMIGQGNITGFERYQAAVVSDVDNSSAYFMISGTNPYASHYLGQVAGADSPTWFMPQYMHYIREGDTREQTSSDSGCATPLAFRSATGSDKIPVRITCTGTQTLNVKGAGAGTYGCTYTYSNAVLLQPCGPDQTIVQGGVLTATIAKIPPPPSGDTAAVVTFFAKPLATQVSVSITPASANLAPGATQPFVSAVTGSNNLGSSFSISPAVGTITSVVSGNVVVGTYTAPAVLAEPYQQITVTATSHADKTKSATALITLIPAPAPQVSVSITPASANLAPGATQQFVSAVSGSENLGSSLSISPAVGTIISVVSGNVVVGMYIAPSVLAVPYQQITVTATSHADNTRSATALITLIPPPAPQVSISITPASANVAPGATQQFVSTVSGSENLGSSFSISPPVGTITSVVFGKVVVGFYTAPAVLAEPYQQITVTATSHADNTRSAAALVTLIRAPN
jgi:hypothetical protein